MKIKTIPYVALLFCLLFNVAAYAKSPVWKISKDGNHLFLGGTFHILQKSDYPLPDSFNVAYKDSAILVLEADLQKLQTPEMQQTILQNGMYKGEDNISRYLKPDTMQALKSYLASRGVPVERVLKFKPGLLSMTLTVIELQNIGLAGTGVDEFYNLKALDDKKKIKFLETALDHMNFVLEMGKGKENEFIKYTLDDLKNLPSLFESMKAAWKIGDNEELRKISILPWKERFPEVYNAMLVDRNNKWIPQIETMMKTGEVELVLFGALHLVGKDGILAQLKERGYMIKNI